MRRPLHSTRFFFLSLLSALSLLAVLTWSSAVPAQDPQSSVNITVLSPSQSDAGEWSGTWYYKTRTEKWALWIRENDGVPELKIQFQNYDQGENFISDWTSLSRYAAKNKKGYFKLQFKHRDANRIEGDWFWQLGTPEVDSSVRTETATFDMYRALRGRQLVLRFHDFERVYEGKRVYRLAAEQAWTFHKASRRLARWQELPF